MKVWITKYALTTGIFEMNAEIVDGKYASGKTPRGGAIFTREFAKSAAEAAKKGDAMRKSRIASLKKSIAKLEKLKFIPMSAE